MILMMLWYLEFQRHHPVDLIRFDVLVYMHVEDEFRLSCFSDLSPAKLYYVCFVCGSCYGGRYGRNLLVVVLESRES